MSFILAGCVLLLALLASIALDGASSFRQHDARDDGLCPGQWT